MHRAARAGKAGSEQNSYPQAPSANPTKKGEATSQPTPGNEPQAPTKIGGQGVITLPSYSPPTPQPSPKHTRTEPQREQAGSRRDPHPPAHTASPGQGRKKAGGNPNPNTYLTRNRNQEKPGEEEPENQAGMPHDRKPSVHSPASEAARAMQMTRPNEVQKRGLRLHPKASAALGLEAERATPKHLRTQVPRTCLWHALGTVYARKFGDLLGFGPKEETCASTGAHPPGVTSASHRQRLALPVLPGAALLGASSPGLRTRKIRGNEHERNLSFIFIFLANEFPEQTRTRFEFRFIEFHTVSVLTLQFVFLVKAVCLSIKHIFS